MREKILTYIERNSRVDLKDLAIMLGDRTDGKRRCDLWISHADRLG